jgi:HSP20 family protein
MTLIKHNRPESDILGRRFSDILDDFFTDAVSTRQSRFIPSVDVAESEKQFEIDIQIPGMKKEDINVNLENGILTISGERTFKNEEKDKKYHRVETRYGSFTRSLQLPDGIDPESVKAAYNDGILSVTVDKSEKKSSKKIKIS